MARVFTPEPGGFGAHALLMGVGEEVHAGNYTRVTDYRFANNRATEYCLNQGRLRSGLTQSVSPLSNGCGLYPLLTAYWIIGSSKI